MRTDDLRRGLADIARAEPAPGAIETVIERGRRRLRRRRVGIGALAIALVGTSAGVVAATRHDARRGVVVTNVPTSVVPATPEAAGSGAEVIFTSASEGWVCSDPILHTADGGEHWQAASYARLATGTHTCAAVPTEAWIFVQAPSGDVTVLPAQGGANIAVTVDFPRVPAGAKVAQATFVDRDHGWVLVRPADGAPGRGLLYRTTTGTGPIRFDLVSDAAPISRVEFVSAAEGWGTDGGSFEHTTDGGATWNAVVIPTLESLPNHQSFFDRLGVAGSTIVVEGLDANASGSAARPFFFVSSDAGASWTRLNGPTATAAVRDSSAFDVVDDMHWRFLFGGRLWSTDDGGRTWSRAEFPPHVVSISFPTLGSNWALDANGAVYRWVDGGTPWERVDTTPVGAWTKLVSIPGDSVGCPTIAPPRTIDRGMSDQDAAVAAARDFVRATRGWTGEQVDAVYPVSLSGGQFGEVFGQNVPRQCGQTVANASWGVELGNSSVTEDSSRSTALVVAPTVDGWRVWGFYR